MTPNNADLFDTVQLVHPNPLEDRPLWIKTSKFQQGMLEMFVQLIPDSKVEETPTWKIDPPPDEDFEVRVICWKTKLKPIKRGRNLRTGGHVLSL